MLLFMNVEFREVHLFHKC